MAQKIELKGKVCEILKVHLIRNTNLGTLTEIVLEFPNEEQAEFYYKNTTNAGQIVCWNGYYNAVKYNVI